MYKMYKMYKMYQRVLREISLLFPFQLVTGQLSLE